MLDNPVPFRDYLDISDGTHAVVYGVIDGETGQDILGICEATPELALAAYYAMYPPLDVASDVYPGY